jgi:hypothetical protein
MSRKEVESEREVQDKWKKVSKTKDVYNESLLPEDGTKAAATPAISKAKGRKEPNPTSK